MSSTEARREDRLERIIADYLVDEDAGASVERSRLLEAHPDLADELLAFFVEHDRIGRLAAPLRAASAAAETVALSTPSSTDPRTKLDPDRGTRVGYFGDYELNKELGRGGMGVVYQARQISLNRSVALKMLKSDVLASDNERRRFQNEAEAVALLDHPHIVPILEVGERDRRKSQ